MKVLVDIISIQGFINGGAEYTRKILYELISERDTKNKSYEIIGLYDSSIPFVENDYTIDFLRKKHIEIIDIRRIKSISEYIKIENIDSFFIGIGQRYSAYNLKNIVCKTILVLHDVYDYEINDNYLNFFLEFRYGSIWMKIKAIIKNVIKSKLFRKDYSNLIRFCNQKNVILITVSEHSKGSIKYYFPELLTKDIKVFYSPQKIAILDVSIKNQTLNSIINSKNKYYLIVNANRRMKNSKFVIDTFQKICSLYNDYYLVTIGSKKSYFNNHIVLPYLSSSDLEHAYKNAFSLVFPSLAEGFGYPPLEAMKYGIPVICSNVCSMPEILENSCLYFSPFYKNDLFNKVMKLENDRSYFAKIAKIRSTIVKERQDKDLISLVDLILK